jgi:signal transduction histidine kinase
LVTIREFGSEDITQHLTDCACIRLRRGSVVVFRNRRRLRERLLDACHERRERLERGRERDRLEECTSIVSHDLRNPLAVADGHVELAREECDGDHLTRVDEAIDRSQALVDDLLALARERKAVAGSDRDGVFEAGHSTTDQGTGFGLRIVEQAAEAHGWDVCVVDGARCGARFESIGVETAR